MIVWGSRVKDDVAEHGLFHCPHCNSFQTYTLIEYNRYSHLWWLFTWHSGTVGHGVRCWKCSLEFRPDALRLPFQPTLTERQQHVNRVTILKHEKASARRRRNLLLTAGGALLVLAAIACVLCDLAWGLIETYGLLR